MWQAHSASRRCTDAQCRRRYYEKVYAEALAGLVELKGLAASHPKFVTLTIRPLMTVPVAWINPHDVRGKWVVGHGGEWFRIEQETATVTLPARGSVAYRYFSMCFNRLITALRQQYGEIWYFRVVEETKQGRPHYHLLVSCPKFIRQRELSRLAAQAGLGAITDIRAIKTMDHATRYATKCAEYATKSQGSFVPRGFRFYARSHSWGAERRAFDKARRTRRKEQRAKEGWVFEYRADDAALTLVEDLLLKGMEVRDERDPRRLLVPVMVGSPEFMPRPPDDSQVNSSDEDLTEAW